MAGPSGRPPFEMNGLSQELERIQPRSANDWTQDFMHHQPQHHQPSFDDMELAFQRSQKQQQQQQQQQQQPSQGKVWVYWLNYK
jgi:hypothetical protein